MVVLHPMLLIRRESLLLNTRIAKSLLAADCLAESSEVDPTVRRFVEEQLDQNLESPEATRRSLAAEVSLIRRLKNLHRIDDNREIDPGFITCAEYQLFVDDMKARDLYHQPDHWQCLTYESGQARAPVTGVRFGDGSAFCEWLTRKQGGNVIYRLPRSEEATLYPSSSSTFGTWSCDENSMGLPGLNSAEQGTIRDHLTFISEISLPQQICFDIERAIDVISKEWHVNDILSSVFFGTFAGLTPAKVRLSYLSVEAITRDIAFELIPDFRMATERNIAGFEANYAERIGHRLDDLIRALGRAISLDETDLIVDCFPNDVISKLNQARSNNLRGAALICDDILSEIAQEEIQWLLTLPKYLLTAMKAESVNESQRILGEYVISILKFCFQNCPSARYPQLGPLIDRQQAEQSRDTRIALLELYWWLKIVQERRKGTIRSWEGIRVIREQTLQIIVK